MERKNESMTVPYIVHESVIARMERIVKRLVVALILTILLMFASNGLWLYAWMQYDYISEDSTVNTNTIDVNGRNGVATYVGDIINGANSGYLNNNSEKTQAETEEEWEQ